MTLKLEHCRGELHADYPLARHTSWRVGGCAEYCYYPADLSDLKHFLAQLTGSEPLTWLGLGSNVLIRDGGIKGVVIVTLNRLKSLGFQGQVVRAEAGVTCAKLAKFCGKNGFEAGAFFAGIPGTVGGALAMNAGAFGGQAWEHVVAVETVDRYGVLHFRKPEAFQVQYRQVDGLGDEYFVAGHFQFPSGNIQSAQEDIKVLLKKRNDSQPIGLYSCGSVFRNPEGDFAARLIESAGLKGTTLGGAEVSEKHANFIVSRGRATALDIERLIDRVVARVFEVHGVRLQKEVHILGEP